MITWFAKIYLAFVRLGKRVSKVKARLKTFCRHYIPARAKWWLKLIADAELVIWIASMLGSVLEAGFFCRNATKIADGVISIFALLNGFLLVAGLLGIMVSLIIFAATGFFLAVRKRAAEIERKQRVKKGGD